MAQVKAQLIIRKRWFFYPAAIIMVVLGNLGIIRDQEKAGKWLADHALRGEIR